ncbi:MAG TPA: hypothetical protein ENH85_03235 [Candidatus Scalindua sp.]|nr:hypothetical protein [Candidatus Scalindua sp.]
MGAKEVSTLLGSVTVHYVKEKGKEYLHFYIKGYLSHTVEVRGKKVIIYQKRENVSFQSMLDMGMEPVKEDK